MNRRLLYCLLLVCWSQMVTVSLTTAAPRVPLPLPSDALVYFGWDTPYFLVPLNAPAINEQNAVRPESWSGYSLLRDSASSIEAVAIPVVESNGRTNFTSAQGAVRFWLAPNWTTVAKGGEGTGPGHFARLLELVNLDGNSSEVRWSLYLDASGSQIYFSGQGQGGAVDFFTAPVRFNAGEWHMITLGYSPTNSSLWIDNQLAANGSGPTAPPLWQQTSLGLIVGSDIAAGNAAEAQFEELATFRRSPDSSWDAYMLDQFYFNISSQMAFLGPVGTREEERDKQAALHELMQVDSMLALDGGFEESLMEGEMMMSSYSSNELWLEITGVTNGWAYVTVHGTEADVPYEVLSKPTLTNSAWLSEGLILGAAASDSTATLIPILDRTNNLFFWARSWADSDGNGMPDWWKLQYFGTLDVDPYGDPDGDGWTNLQEYENGTSPTQFDTPPPPRAVSVTIDWAGTNFVLNWESGGGAVTSYEIDDYWGNQVDSVSSSTFTATENPATAFLTNPFQNGPPYYRIRARFGNSASSSISAPVSVFSSGITPDTRLIRGLGGKMYIVLLGPATNVSAVRVFWLRVDPNTFEYFPHSFDIAITNFVNGAVPIPDAVMEQNTAGYMIVQGIRSDGALGEQNSVWLYVAEETTPWPAQFQFVDARTHLKENLKFLLRSATVNIPFSYSTTNVCCDTDTYPLSWASVSTDYEHYGFRFSLPGWTFNYALLQDVRPMHDNYMFRNFAHSSGDFSNTTFRTGALWDTIWNIRVLGNNPLGAAKYHYTGSGYESPLPLSYSNDSFPWIFYRAVNDSGQFFDAAAAAEAGVYTNTISTRLLATGVRNVFGLPLLSLRAGPSTLVSAGSTFVRTNNPYFPNFESPQLQTVDYYFVSQTAYINFDVDLPPLVPGSPEFSITNTSPLIVASVGQPITVASWAKQAIQNGYTNKFAFLEQYFDAAYHVGTNGIATTNKTGILSPYGEFLPLEPGPTALVTMPDPETGARGTGIVHAISLNADVNHDGTMDFSFGGPDAAQSSRPYRFWINDDSDSGETGGDDIPGKWSWVADGSHDVGAFGVTIHVVEGVRDLVDFFPVYLNIQSLLDVLPPSSEVQYKLKHADSALNFCYTHLGADNYMDYLQNTNVARSLGGAIVTPIPAAGTNLTVDFLHELRTNGHGIILIEATKATRQPLVLEVWRGTDLLAQTQLPLEITGVEQMFRHKNLIRAVWTNSTTGLPDRLTDASVPNEPENNGKNFVFLHGYNVNPNQARGNFAETFKRLYWSGSHAKFYGVTWKGSTSQEFGKLTPNYHTNVANAFLAAPKLRDFVATLSNEVTVAAHSLGNMAVLSAISDWDAPITRYFMIDAAVAIECVEGNAPQSTNMIVSGWIAYAQRLYASSWHSLFQANDHRSELTWVDRLSNFHNADVFNFYSSGEEVLRTHVGFPPIDAIGGLSGQLYEYFKNHLPFGTYAWAWQEKGKGLFNQDGFLGSSHGGWRFNPNYDDQTNIVHLPPNQADLLPDSQLRTNAFFAFGAAADTNFDAVLLGSGGSAYAQANRHRILSDAIPALTLPIGANPVPRLSPQGQPSRNFDMNALYQNGWSLDRPTSGSEAFKWYHSDFKNVAYTFTYPLFDQFVTLGNLK